MKSHTVEVDDEVFEFVKRNAEPLVDDFNSTIKRLLGLTKSTIVKKAISQSQSISTGLDYTSGPPQALKQILEVIHLVITMHQSRRDATKAVANKYGVEYQTVIDKYCRQLNITADKFDHMLLYSRQELKQILMAKFPNYYALIESVMVQV